MQIDQQRFLDVLGTPDTRFAIPVFQRVYSWNERQCDELWDDIVAAGRDREPHFMGMLLCCPDAESWHGMQLLDVIDGQQRMTTTTLLLVALRGYLMGAGRMKAPGSGVPEPDEIAQRFLQVSADGQAAAKLVLSHMDRETLAALVGAGDMPEEPAARLVDNCLLFSKKMEQPGFDLAGFWRGLNLLQAARITMGSDDSPQLVFESLNSKGMPLSTADRVRNLIIASTSGSEQERLYTAFWLPLEDRTASAAVATTPTDVLHAWLAARYRSVRILDESEVYGVFKTCLAKEYGGNLENLLAEVLDYCERFTSDEEFRCDAQVNAEEWVAGKPEKSVSEFKLFGD